MESMTRTVFCTKSVHDSLRQAIWQTRGNAEPAITTPIVGEWRFVSLSPRPRIPITKIGRNDRALYTEVRPSMISLKGGIVVKRRQVDVLGAENTTNLEPIFKTIYSH
jgi:hypothetical protein